MQALNLLDYKEHKQHGSVYFPVMTYRENLREGHPITLHWHEEIEICTITAGSATYCVGDRRIQVARGDLLIIDPYTLHAVYSTDGVGESIIFNWYFLESQRDDCVNTKYIQPFLGREPDAPLLIRADDPGHEPLAQTFRRIVDAFERKRPAYELHVKAGLLEFTATLYEYGYHRPEERAEGAGRPSDGMKAVLEYLQYNYNKEITLAETARRAGYSANYFSRMFKEQTGKNLLEYLNEYRIQRAAQMLVLSESHVTDIALEVGFNNISYFIRLFKKYHGCSPVQYRKSLRRTPA